MGQGHFNSFKSIFPVSHFFVGWGVAQKTREREREGKKKEKELLSYGFPAPAPLILERLPVFPPLFFST
jgi:hypothetical protein